MTTAIALAGEPPGYVDPQDESTELFFDARQTLLSQYANSPIIAALVESLNYALDLKAALNAFYRTVWNIETASGFGLDIWGRIVGVSRALYVNDSQFLGFSSSTDVVPFGSGIFWGAGRLTPNFRLTDIAYRRLILAKAALNITDCSVPAINTILRALFPDYGNVYVRDNGDMTITYVFGVELSKLDYAIVSQSGALPKPVGVLTSILVEVDGSDAEGPSAGLLDGGTALSAGNSLMDGGAA